LSSHLTTTATVVSRGPTPALLAPLIGGLAHLDAPVALV